jgi:hypothetical protein
MPTIKELAATMGVRDEEKRVLGASEIIAICGIIGGVFSDLSIKLSLIRLGLAARTAAIDLRDADIIHADDRGALTLRRLPATAVERRLLREALGLQHNRSDK